MQDGDELQPTETGITLDPVEWEHLADALPDLQAALGSVNVNFQACAVHCVLTGFHLHEPNTYRTERPVLEFLSASASCVLKCLIGQYRPAFNPVCMACLSI